jgi:MOSC domain-containing protein YiiM
VVLDLSWRFDRWFDQLPRSPRDEGRVERCVVRTGPGQRETPEALELVPGRGVVGDTWLEHEHSVPDSEVSLINVHVIRSLCDGDEALTPLSGDNLQVDLDLSEENLPVGTRLAIGDEVVIVVAPYPHRPCRSFLGRFGETAAKKVARANRRGLRGRGVLCTVQRGGTLRRGDPIRVERPGPTGG